VKISFLTQRKSRERLKKSRGFKKEEVREREVAGYSEGGSIVL
jgi:hypothetical protein